MMTIARWNEVKVASVPLADGLRPIAADNAYALTITMKLERYADFFATIATQRLVSYTTIQNVY